MSSPNVSLLPQLFHFSLFIHVFSRVLLFLFFFFCLSLFSLNLQRHLLLGSFFVFLFSTWCIVFFLFLVFHNAILLSCLLCVVLCFLLVFFFSSCIHFSSTSASSSPPLSYRHLPPPCPPRPPRPPCPPCPSLYEIFCVTLPSTFSPSLSLINLREHSGLPVSSHFGDNKAGGGRK